MTAVFSGGRLTAEDEVHLATDAQRRPEEVEPEWPPVRRRTFIGQWFARGKRSRAQEPGRRTPDGQAGSSTGSSTDIGRESADQSPHPVEAARRSHPSTRTAVATC
jgi:hypothetical protein